ncbi:MAG: carbohydrate ABC transporter permease [Firmicutes bacterium]|nr:carbohydrate ABC transporter permease [Bacillota bacterium]
MPVILVIVVSFSGEQSVLRYGFSFFPKQWSLEAYKFLFALRYQLFNAYWITIQVTLLGTVLSLMTMSFYAYAISRKDFKYRNFFTFFVVITIMFNGGLVPWYLVSTQLLHLQDRLWGLIFPYLMDAWWVLILRTNFRTSVPEELIEAAKIDGAGEFRLFFSVVAPLARAALATIGLLCTLRFWNDWWLGLLLINDPRKTPLQLLLYRVYNAIQFLLQSPGNLPKEDVLSNLPANTVRMAMCVVVIAPILVVFPFFQRYFVKGLTIGAIKS